MREPSQGRDRRWRRRLVSVPLVCLTGVLSVVLLPAWLPLAAAVDVVRRSPWVAVRCGLFLMWFAWLEIVGLCGAGLILVASIGRPERRASGLYGLQRMWSGGALWGAQRIFDFSLEVEGDTQPPDAPMLLFLRHASMADTLLPAALFANVHGTRLRYVIKRELLVDPCLDIVGNRLPNYFVDRASADSAREIEAIHALGRDLGAGEGVLIYPEGTRFTASKRRRIIEKLGAAGDERGAARATQLQRVLPARRGGPLALLEAAPDAHVVFVAHTGFEAAGTFPSLWRGDLVGRTIRVCLWRVERTAIPDDRSAREAWLDEHWLRIDGWLGRVEGTE